MDSAHAIVSLLQKQLQWHGWISRNNLKLVFSKAGHLPENFGFQKDYLLKNHNRYMKIKMLVKQFSPPNFFLRLHNFIQNTHRGPKEDKPKRTWYSFLTKEQFKRNLFRLSLLNSNPAKYFTWNTVKKHLTRISTQRGRKMSYLYTHIHLTWL